MQKQCWINTSISIVGVTVYGHLIHSLMHDVLINVCNVGNEWLKRYSLNICFNSRVGRKELLDMNIWRMTKILLSDNAAPSHHLNHNIVVVYWPPGSKEYNYFIQYTVTWHDNHCRKNGNKTCRIEHVDRIIFGHSLTVTHYSDVIMGATASQITSLTMVYSTFYSGADLRKHQSSAPLAFARGIHRRPVNSPHKWPVTQKMFPFDDVIMNGQTELSVHQCCSQDMHRNNDQILSEFCTNYNSWAVVTCEKFCNQKFSNTNFFKISVMTL